MLCGVELQEVCNAEGSQVVAVTRKQEMQMVTEAVAVDVTSSTSLADGTRLTAAPSTSRK